MVEDLTLEIQDTPFLELDTDIPRWKAGIKLKNKEPRSIFDEIYRLVRKHGGKYSKDAGCWIFSSAKRRTAFIEAVRNYQQYSSDPELAELERKMEEVLDKRSKCDDGKEWDEYMHQYTLLLKKYHEKGGK